MRRTVLALVAATALLAACSQQRGESPEAAPEETAAAAPAPEMPFDAPPQEEVGPAVPTPKTGEAAACGSAIGAQSAARLVERCIAVSPATRPPCNVANPCQMIQDEIDRACAMYGPGETKPAECTA